MFSHHAGLLVEVHADGPEAVGGQHADEHDDLDEGDPVREVGPVVGRVAAQLATPVALGRASTDTPPRAPAHGTPHGAHAVFPPGISARVSINALGRCEGHFERHCAAIIYSYPVFDIDVKTFIVPLRAIMIVVRAQLPP